METSPWIRGTVNSGCTRFRQIRLLQTSGYSRSGQPQSRCTLGRQLQAKHSESAFRSTRVLIMGVNLHFPPTANIADHSRPTFSLRRTHNRKNRKVCAKRTSIRSILQRLFCVRVHNQRSAEQVSGINSSDASCFCDAQYRGLNYD
jgi:hypothetical protein